MDGTFVVPKDQSIVESDIKDAGVTNGVDEADETTDLTEGEDVGMSGLASVLLVACIVLFIIPWIVLGIWMYRKKSKRNRLRHQKELQQ